MSISPVRLRAGVRAPTAAGLESVCLVERNGNRTGAQRAVGLTGVANRPMPP
ncbi:MAG: hypothetical protein MPJ50_11520 [Pirellulales bacterium]|nr:hypothetical protein [Pirellulales bacterium]